MDVGEIFVSAFFSLLIDKLFLPELIEIVGRGGGLQTAIHKLDRTLKEISAVLNDAEQKQIRNKTVKLWLEELNDLAYDADDILDEIATEALRRRTLMADQPESKVRRVMNYVFTSSSALAFNFTMGSKINEINRQLEDIATRKTTLGLVEKYLVGETLSKKDQWHRPHTTSLAIEPFIYGRDKDKEEIIELLLKADALIGNNFGVIPIVGMGGIGKTTLAQLVYNDDKVKNHFNMKAWVCVSDEDFDVKRITRAIIESFTLTPCTLNELNALQVLLNKMLTGKKFLLVLDDVWNKRYDQWNLLRSPFRAGAQGSKIIVTTRENEVALQMGGSIQSHHLIKLSNDDCWSIFAKHAFENRSISEHPKLEIIGKEIVKKCGGLPLAARTLGGLLRYKQRDEEWEDVLNSEIWKLSPEKNDILPALKLSYHHLPPHLKRCFEYCAVIPKDYVFEEKEIVLLWMAEGLIHGPEGNQQILEDLGCEYFHELVSRSLIQPSSTSSTDNSQFIMHDLINDLAQVVAGEMYFRLENKLEGCSQSKIGKRTRRVSYTSSKYDGIKRFEILGEAECLRTFLLFTSSHKFSERYITRYVLSDLLPKLKCLRVLCLSNYDIRTLPDSIGDLKHLRYLNLSYTWIRRLPKSVVTLYNLQVMLLKECGELQELPFKMGNMINLRHLDITGAERLKEMPLQMGKLTNLQTLSKFKVGREGSGSSIRELRNLHHLRGTIAISSLENVTDAGDAREVNLKSKQGIKELFLEWRDDSGNGEIATNVLDFLQPHDLSLEQLTIKGCTGTRFPTWLGDSSFSRMVLLRLEDCENCTSLPPLGQLSFLKDLTIQGMRGVEQVGPEFYGEDCSKPFPSLENLTFADMEEWKYWFSYGVEPFTRLSKLCIRDCNKLLGELPKHLPSLKELVIKKCPQLVVTFPPNLGRLPESETQTGNSIDLSCPLTYLSISDVSIPASLCNPNVADEVVVLTNAASNHLKSLTRLHVEYIPKLTSLPLWFIQELTGLQELKIDNCRELASLWQNEVRLQHHHFPALLRLEISVCPQLVCFFEEKEEEEQKGQHEELPCLRMLEYLRLSHCAKLEKLPRDLHTLTFLKYLTIEYCPWFIYFPKGGLPSTLRTLEISSCEALRSLTEGLEHNDSIEVLDVRYCPSLTCLSYRGALPHTLKVLRIFNCEKLESIVDEGLKINSSLHSVSIAFCGNLKALPDGPHNLSELRIGGCDNLESLPEGWLSTTSLRELKIYDCRKLEALPNHAHNLTSLQRLDLGVFPGAVSYFLQGNLPTNLNSLSIYNIKLPSPSDQWGLRRLSCLRELDISGGCPDLVSFPEVGMSLPTSLIELHITDFPNLEDLSSEFQNLISLERLFINDCPKLKSFPDQGLPQSLLLLSICGCPLLQQRCERERGKYRPIIAHIPCVYIDRTFILDP